ncbi:MAG TPA: hypothetical protein GX714_00115 [Chloroflexi bacterium]|jgi:hypothetical protein|nr:hypothetical protein [Chloroflexota bacterium]
MPVLVAFASLPFGLRGGDYEIAVSEDETVTAHITERAYSPFVTISSRPELAQSIPQNGETDGFTSYTWYDHPFVLRVLFGRNVASLGSINSCATILQMLPDDLDLEDHERLDALRDAFSAQALVALNTLIAAVRHKARLYHVFDLRRDDIDVSVRREDGSLLVEDPLQAELTAQEERASESFDLQTRSEDWYRELAQAIGEPDPVGLADDLLMEADRALAQRFPRQAITTCHTAVETAVSALLTRGMVRRNVPDREIDDTLSTRSLTSKLDALLRVYTGFTLKRDNAPLWRSFNALNDLRNDIVHRGKRPTVAEAEGALCTARELVSWLQMVRGRNK